MKNLHFKFQGHRKSVLNCWNARTVFTGALMRNWLDPVSCIRLKDVWEHKTGREIPTYPTAGLRLWWVVGDHWAGEKHVNTYGLIKWTKYNNYQKKNGIEKGGKESKTTDCYIVSEVGSKGCCLQKTGSKRLREKGLTTLEKLWIQQ